MRGRPKPLDALMKEEGKDRRRSGGPNPICKAAKEQERGGLVRDGEVEAEAPAVELQEEEAAGDDEWHEEDEAEEADVFGFGAWA